MVQNKVRAAAITAAKALHFLETKYIGVNVIKGLGQGCLTILPVADGPRACFLKQNDIVHVQRRHPQAVIWRGGQGAVTTIEDVRRTGGQNNCRNAAHHDFQDTFHASPHRHAYRDRFWMGPLGDWHNCERGLLFNSDGDHFGHKSGAVGNMAAGTERHLQGIYARVQIQCHLCLAFAKVQVVVIRR